MNLSLSDERSVCLVSKSPRRRECLKEFVSEFNTDLVSEKEELVFFEKMSEVAHYLALQKQKHFLQKNINNDRYVITSDTIVYYEPEKKLLGKPRNIKDAENMLRYHLGKQHKVATALVITDRYSGKLHSVVDTTVVRFKPYSRDIESAIQDYLILNPPHGPLDKAGAYGIQEVLIKKNLIEGIEGDESTVIGFPMIKFKKLWDDLLIR
ncbi:MAG: hypothetical protein A2Y40_02865 [Candidatus Margulisbacteria bacterium GWF2_35_9]|nr:MAG: hypothetical protein A2Y40_02865 [Candidatus Margulisbacteria bacterium GWF2_35_9]